jgi:glutathione S-transferase
MRDADGPPPEQLAFSSAFLWLLEEMGTPYEIAKYQRMSPLPMAPPELKEVHPLGKSPVITDGNKTIAESGRSSST